MRITNVRGIYNKQRRNLESADVVVIPIEGPHAINGPDFWVSGHERDAEANIGLDSIRSKQT